MFKWVRGFTTGVFGLSFVILAWVLYVYVERDREDRKRRRNPSDYWREYWGGKDPKK